MSSPIYRESNDARTSIGGKTGDDEGPRRELSPSISGGVATGRPSRDLVALQRPREPTRSAADVTASTPVRCVRRATKFGAAVSPDVDRKQRPEKLLRVVHVAVVDGHYGFAFE